MLFLSSYIWERFINGVLELDVLKIIYILKMNNKISKIAYLSSYPPRKCGVGRHTADTVKANGSNAMVLPIDKYNEDYLWPIGQEHIVNQMDSSSYQRAGELIVQEDAISKIKKKGRVIADSEHEYGLDGNGRDNNYNLFGRTLKEGGVPCVARLHTVIDPKLHELEDFRIKILKEMAENYTKLIVLTPSAKKVLTEEPYNIDPDKIVYIPHGIVEAGRGISKEVKKRRFGLEDRITAGTPGMVSKGKGLEFSLLGVSAFLKSIPESERKKFNYIILGGSHPEVLEKNNEEDPYREMLWKLAVDEKLNPLELKDENINKKRKLDLDEHKVIFVNTFISNNVLEEFIQSLDIGMTTYKNPTQCSSGIGAKLAGHGIPCVSSKFMFHNDLFRDVNGRKDNSGYLVPFKGEFPVKPDEASLDPDEIAKGIRHVLDNYSEMRAKILGKGVQMGWSVVGAQNIHLYNDLISGNFPHRKL